MVARFTETIRRHLDRVRRDRYVIRVRVERDDLDGGYVSSVVGLPGVMSQGETEEEAVHNAIDALACYVQAEIETAHPEPVNGAHEHRILLPA